MLKDLIIVPNFFDNVEGLVSLAKQQKFYSNTEHPKDKNTKIYYGGKRTEELTGIEKTILSETFYNKVVCDNLSINANVKVDWAGSSFFHFFTNNYSGGKPELHQDSALMAGVIYLNSCILSNPENHGTIIFNKNDESFTMPYIYNTLIMYRSDYIHAPLAGFGNSIDDARLSMIFTIDKITIDVSRNTL